MDRQHIVAVLREHEAELKAAGLAHLRLFGSAARGEEHAASDIDLLFDTDRNDWDLFGVYDYEARVTEILGTKAHLSSTRLIRPQAMRNALQEAIVVY